MSQGISTRETCPDDILLTLLNDNMRFEQLVSTLKYSRGTINKYLNELFNAEKITRRGRRGVYYLTPKGKKEAEKVNSVTQFKKLTLEEQKGLLNEVERYRRRLRIKELESMDLRHEWLTRILRVMPNIKIDEITTENIPKGELEKATPNIILKQVTSLEHIKHYAIPGWKILLKPEGYPYTHNEEEDMMLIGIYKELSELYQDEIREIGCENFSNQGYRWLVRLFLLEEGYTDSEIDEAWTEKGWSKIEALFAATKTKKKKQRKIKILPFL